MKSDTTTRTSASRTRGALRAVRAASLATASAVVLGGAVAGLFGAAPAAAEEGTLVKNLLGSIGVIDQDREPIRYHERAPLALPPSTGKLPEPRASAAKRVDGWPDDADLQRRRREAAERQRPVPFPNDNQPKDGGRLSVYEMERISRRPRHAAEDNQPRKVLGDGRESTWVDPDALRSTATGPSDGKKLKPGVEPSRANLLQPPPGYRMPAGDGRMKATPDEPMPFKRDHRPEQDFYKPPAD